jgi:hypothetical protein
MPEIVQTVLDIANTILSLPFLGEMIATAIVGFVSIKVRDLLHRTTLMVNAGGKKSFDLLPSWFKVIVYKSVAEAKTMFPTATLDELVDIASEKAKNSIKGKLDDIVIDACRSEIKAFVHELYGEPIPVEEPMATLEVKQEELSVTPGLNIDMTKEI